MDTGANWVCLAFPVNQKTYASTEILFDYRKNVPDLELLTTIKRFHDRGVKVCLKPMINSDDGVWRALIDFPDQTMMEEDTYWAKWFASQNRPRFLPYELSTHLLFSLCLNLPWPPVPCRL